MENQGPFAHVTYPSAKAIKCRGLAPGGVVVEFCTFGDYNDTHKVSLPQPRRIHRPTKLTCT